MSNIDWYDARLLWLDKWVKTYKDNVVNAYNILNDELIPTKQYERALIWCLHVFDITVLTHQMISLVYETEGKEICSVYYLPINDLVDILKRLENQMIQCRNMFDELLTLNSIDQMYMATSTLSVDNGKKAEPDNMTDEIVTLPTSLVTYVPDPRHAELIVDLMRSKGDELIDQKLLDLAMSLELLRAASNRAAVRAENLDQRLPSNYVRAILLVASPDDGELARMVVESYLAKLKHSVNNVKIYRVDYGGLLSKWRGESEKNFENLMQWMVERARQNAIDERGFDVLWLDNIHVLMGKRGDGGSEDFLSVIKTTMLTIMDDFNKNKSLSRFALVFSTGASLSDVDSAFRRRMDFTYELPSLSRSQGLRDLLIQHALRMTKLNIEGKALTRLKLIDNMSALQSLVYAYYVKARFTIGTEFHIIKPGVSGYSLKPLKEYFNLNGEVVRTGNPDCQILQAVERHEESVKEQRWFYRPGEVDARNLTKEMAAYTVYVMDELSDTE